MDVSLLNYVDPLLILLDSNTQERASSLLELGEARVGLDEYDLFDYFSDLADIESLEAAACPFNFTSSHLLVLIVLLAYLVLLIHLMLAMIIVPSVRDCD